MRTKSIVLASTIISGLLFSADAMAQASVEFHGHVTSGPTSSEVYHDKTYTFSYCDGAYNSPSCTTHKSLGTIIEDENGQISPQTGLVTTMTDVEGPVTLFVSVIKGISAMGATQDDIAGSYRSSFTLTPTNGKLDVNFDALPPDWTKQS